MTKPNPDKTNDNEIRKVWAASSNTLTSHEPMI